MKFRTKNSLLYLSFCVIKQFAKLRTKFCTVRVNAFTFKFLWQSYLTLTHLSFFCTSHVLGTISWRPVDPSYFASELNNFLALHSKTRYRKGSRKRSVDAIDIVKLGSWSISNLKTQKRTRADVVI